MLSVAGEASPAHRVGALTPASAVHVVRVGATQRPRTGRGHEPKSYKVAASPGPAARFACGSPATPAHSARQGSGAIRSLLKSRTRGPIDTIGGAARWLAAPSRGEAACRS